MRFLLCLLPLLLFLTSCAQERSYTLKNLLIDPQITTIHYTDDVQNIGIQVTDKRSDARVGMKRFGFEKESPILVLDTARPILEAFRKELLKMGLHATSFHETSHLSLDIKLIDIDYNKKARIVSGDEKMTVKAEVVASKNGNTITRYYETVSYDSDLMRPSATYQLKQIDQSISDGLAQLIRKILTDQNLLEFLQG